MRQAPTLREACEGAVQAFALKIVPVMVPNAAATSSPAVSAVALHQKHVLVPSNLATASPSVSSPLLLSGQMNPNQVATGSPAVSAVAINQKHVLTPTQVATASPAITSPAVGQKHALTPSSLATSSPAVSAVALNTAAWTPASAGSELVASIDGSTVAWSASNFGTTANPGSLGGNIVAEDGTVTKGTQLNGYDTLNLDGADSLKTSANYNFPGGNVCIFAVFKGSAGIQTLVSHAWATTTSGFVGYTQPWIMSDGYQGGQPAARGLSPSYGSVHNLLTMLAGTTSYTKVNGDALSLDISDAAANDANAAGVPIYFFKTGGGEYLTGEVAYIALLVGAAPGVISKFEGWASWRFFGDGSKLPIGHAYKSAPPTV